MVPAREIYRLLALPAAVVGYLPATRTSSASRALLIWRIANAALPLTGGLAVIDGLRRAGLALPSWGGLLFLALLPVCEATPQTLAVGQTSILVFTGFSLIAHAMLADCTPTMAIGLLLVCLKPQFGTAAMLPLLLLPRWWKAITIALIASLIFALPQFAAHRIADTAAGFLRNLSRHGALASNQPV